MNHYLMQSFLTSFFTLEAVCGAFMNDVEKQKMYIALSKLYGLKDRTLLKQCYTLSQETELSSIRTAADYERFCRVLSFARSVGQDPQITALDRMMLSCKGDAMAAVKTFDGGSEMLTETGVTVRLQNKAAGGNVRAAEVLAFMEYNGICTARKQKKAIAAVAKFSCWNSLFCNLMGLAWDADSRDTYIGNLYTFLHHHALDEEFDHICTAFGCEKPSEISTQVLLVEEGFAREIIERNRFDSIFAEVAVSELLSMQDKEKLLLTGKNYASSLPKLPYGVHRNGTLSVNTDKAADLPASRAQERESILRNLRITQLCPPSARKPLLLVSSDAFVSERYARWLKTCIDGVPVVELDAAKLENYDFAGNENNVFLRSLAKTQTTRTVFFIYNCESLSAESADELMKMLAFEYRKQCPFAQLQVAPDLSEMMFVLFTHPEQVGLHLFSRECETVRLQRISESEKRWMVETVFNTCKEEFAVPHLTADAEVIDYLCAYNAGTVQQLLYAVIKDTVVDGKTNVTVQALMKVGAENKTNSVTRTFGFTGGSENA